MDIKIKYNDEIDEFTWDLTLNMRMERYIKEHFYPAYTISILAPVYLVGGGVRDLTFCSKKSLTSKVGMNCVYLCLNNTKIHNIIKSVDKERKVICDGIRQ